MEVKICNCKISIVINKLIVGRVNMEVSNGSEDL